MKIEFANNITNWWKEVRGGLKNRTRIGMLWI